MKSSNVLEYKNFWLFYSNLYDRLFSLINIIIDENKFNINKVKDNLTDFMDNYSYYLIKKEMLVDDNIVHDSKDIIERLQKFDMFTKQIKNYPSQEYIKIRLSLKNNSYDLTQLTNEQYKLLLREYYLFFDDCLDILKKFIDITSINGFLPNIKSKKAFKSIGYANYEAFFKELESLKIKMSEITSTLNINNIFKSRRCMYSVMTVFSPYFKDKTTYDLLVSKLDFNFINDDKIMFKMKQLTGISQENISKTLKDEINTTILKDLKNNISIIKRFISYEFGERDMSPKIKSKYLEDPTDT